MRKFALKGRKRWIGREAHRFSVLVASVEDLEGLGSVATGCTPAVRYPRAGTGTLTQNVAHGPGLVDGPVPGGGLGPVPGRSSLLQGPCAALHPGDWIDE